MDDERFKLYRKDHLFQDVLGRGVLDGYSLKFTRKASDGGRADMMEIGGTIEGKVYQIEHEALECLFLLEGVEGHIYRLAFIDSSINDKVVKDALTFLVIDKAEREVLPPEKYLAEIRRGGKSVWTSEYEKSFEAKLQKLCYVTVE